MTVKTIIKRLRQDERGATAIEYGLIASLIVLAIVGAFQTVATETITMWTTVSDTVDEAVENGDG